TEVLDRLSRSHVLAHPSLHDSGGWVILEAGALGVPVVCLDLGGPGLQVTTETGIKIPVDHASDVVPAMTNALNFLAENPTHAATLGANARKRVAEHFTWNAIGDRLATMEPYCRMKSDITAIPT